jgi:hypothetical protein
MTDDNNEKVCSGGCPEEERMKNACKVDDLEKKLNLNQRFDLSEIRQEITAFDGDKEVVYVGELTSLSVSYDSYPAIMRRIKGLLNLTKYERKKGTRTKTRLKGFKFVTEEVPYVKNKKIWSLYIPSTKGERDVVYKDKVYDIKKIVSDAAFNRGIGLKPKLFEVIFNPIAEELTKRIEDSKEFDRSNNPIGFK